MVCSEVTYLVSDDVLCFSDRVNLREDDRWKDLHGNVDSTKLEALQAQEFCQSRGWFNCQILRIYLSKFNRNKITSFSLSLQ